MGRWLFLLCAAACGGDGDGGGGSKDADPASDSTVQDTSMPTADAAFQPGALCGATTCMPTQVCCTGAMIACKAAADCPTQFFECDGPEDCSGGTCCFGSGGQGGSTCRGAGQNCNDRACHYDSDCSGGTPKCCPKMFTPSYGVCQAAC